jgi:hypothetical protein
MADTDTLAVGEPTDTPEVEPDRVNVNGSHPRSDEFRGIDIVDSGDEVDYASMAPKLLTGRMVEDAKANKSFLLTLHTMSIEAGEKVGAEVKLVNLTDKTLLGAVPHNVREMIERLFFSAPASQRGNKANKRIRTDQTASRIRDVGYAYGCAGFVNPKLVLTEAEADPDNNVVWVGDIPLHDLTEYARICEGDDALAARRLEPFSQQ